MSKTYKPKKKKRAKTHGFLARKNNGSEKVIADRRKKGRKRLSPV